MKLVEGIADVDDLNEFLATLNDIATTHGSTVQAFDARYIVDRTHLERAVACADRAIDRGENVARDRSVEILCYAAGRRQIDQALELGVAPGRTPVVVLVDGGDEAEAATTVSEQLDPASTLGCYDERSVRAFFDIGEAELSVVSGRVVALVHERVALLDVEK